MTKPIVKTAMESDEAGVIDALKLAFVGDPATLWVWPDPQRYLSHFSSFAKAFGGKAIVRRGVTATHPELNYKGEEAFWADVTIYPGMSDSPVFILDYGVQYYKTGGYSHGAIYVEEILQKVRDLFVS